MVSGGMSTIFPMLETGNAQWITIRTKCPDYLASEEKRRLQSKAI